MNDRSRVIIRTSVIGILTNLLLAGFKAAVGLFANSIAIVLDAVNNLSDALSSVITIIGTRLAGKKPDKQHPYGHGRVEYLSAAVISAAFIAAFALLRMASVNILNTQIGIVWTSVIFHFVETAGLLLLALYLRERYNGV